MDKINSVYPLKPQSKRMLFEEVGSDCVICTSHKYHVSGYLYKTWKRDGKTIRMGYHRFVYQVFNGLNEIPLGHEVDHVCSNPSCCNPQHLRLLTIADHKRETSSERFHDRFVDAFYHWEKHNSQDEPCSTACLAERYSVTMRTAQIWVNRFKRGDILSYSANEVILPPHVS